MLEEISQNLLDKSMMPVVVIQAIDLLLLMRGFSKYS